MAEDSVFTKIIKGEIPSYKVYEDDKTLAFLDIHPIQPGMTLVISKTQVPTFMDLSEEDYQALWRTVKKVAERLRMVFPEKKQIGLQVEGLDVPHVHVKLFPIDTGSEFRSVADASTEPEHASLAALAQTLAFQ
jgi:histidine triad (HIT) family protein